MDARLSRLQSADRLAAGGAIALFVFMFFFDWFGENVSGTLPGSNLTGAGTSYSGWDTFTDSRWIWLLTIVVALASVASIAAGGHLRSWLPPGAIVMLLGLLSVVLIVYRIVHHPAASASFGGFHASYGIKLGIWLGLLAALAIAAGGYLQLHGEGEPGGDRDDPRPASPDAFSGLTVTGASPPAAAQPGDEPPSAAGDGG